jgi:hypothetical protein
MEPPTTPFDGPEEPESHHACVVYDPQTGQIHHVHEVINLPGAQAPNQAEMEQRALHHTPKYASTDLAVLVVPSTHLEREKFYRVDHEKRELAVEPVVSEYPLHSDAAASEYPSQSHDM